MKRERKRAAAAAPAPDLSQDLFGAIAELRSGKEVAHFMRDLCTAQELQAMAARWQVVRLLDQGLHYHDIVQRTGVSTATISRVNTWLRFGTGGYRSVLDRRHGGGG